jgi:quinol monooxygenase YgiN
VTVLVLERYQADPSHTARFEELALERVTRMREAHGALWADLSRSSDDAGGYLLASEWRTDEDAEAFDPPSEDFGSVLTGEITRRRFLSPA